MRERFGVRVVILGCVATEFDAVTNRVRKAELAAPLGDSEPRSGRLWPRASLAAVRVLLATGSRAMVARWAHGTLPSLRIRRGASSDSTLWPWPGSPTSQGRWARSSRCASRSSRWYCASRQGGGEDIHWAFPCHGSATERLTNLFDGLSLLP